MPFIYSTLTSSMVYALYEKGANDLPLKVAEVKIEGGAGLASKHLITPLGVRTEVTENELELLKGNKVFQLHVENGFISIEKSKIDPDVKAADMSQRDNSSPLVENDFQDSEVDGTVIRKVAGKSKKG